jgi:3(or 17)beta-hydroxysteroid dehydrogenase
MSGRVKDKVALLTGAESAAGGVVGLARASALMLAREGAKVVATDIAPKAEGSVAEEIHGNGGEAIFVRQDVSVEADWQKAIAAALDAFGKVDIVVNMAAIALDGSVEDTTLRDWRQHMAVNLDGVFLGTKYGVEAMKAAGGSIINISSIYGLVGGGTLAAYCAAKAGVRNLSKSAALHCAASGYGIRVNSLHPGFCQTPMTEAYWRGKGDLEKGLATISELTPLGRVGRPDDIAYGVVYLASDESNFVTGAELVIDGGFSAQ